MKTNTMFAFVWSLRNLLIWQKIYLVKELPLRVSCFDVFVRHGLLLFLVTLIINFDNKQYH